METPEQPQESEETLTAEQAKMQIDMIWQQIGQFGAITDEKDRIDDVKQRLEAGRIPPQAAVEEAHQILTQKNGYGTHYR